MDILVEQEVALHQYETRQNKNDIKRLIHPFFSALALILAWYKCADKWLSLSGQKIKTEAELAVEEENRLKEHYHYH